MDETSLINDKKRIYRNLFIPLIILFPSFTFYIFIIIPILTGLVLNWVQWFLFFLMISTGTSTIVWILKYKVPKRVSFSNEYIIFHYRNKDHIRLWSEIKIRFIHKNKSVYMINYVEGGIEAYVGRNIIDHIRKHYQHVIPDIATIKKKKLSKDEKRKLLLPFGIISYFTMGISWGLFILYSSQFPVYFTVWMIILTAIITMAIIIVWKYC